VPVRCAVMDFGIKKGLMNSDVFVIDTKETNILGEGQISLAEETIKMKLSPQPKDFSIMSLRTPVHITGTLKEPTIYPDKMLAIRAGAAVLLGVLATPLASLIPLIETGPGEDNNCRALIASVKQPQPAHKKKKQAKKY
jgi:AsmA family protein